MRSGKIKLSDKITALSLLVSFIALIFSALFGIDNKNFQRDMNATQYDQQLRLKTLEYSAQVLLEEARAAHLQVLRDYPASDMLTDKFSYGLNVLSSGGTAAQGIQIMVVENDFPISDCIFAAPYDDLKPKISENLGRKIYTYDIPVLPFERQIVLVCASTVPTPSKQLLTKLLSKIPKDCIIDTDLELSAHLPTFTVTSINVTRDRIAQQCLAATVPISSIATSAATP
jgi:hypothetical protein